MTSFVTEYRRRESRHTAAYTVEAEFCNQLEVEEQLRALLIDYRALFHEDLVDDRYKGEDSEYYKVLRRSESALAVLQAIFPGKEQVEPVNLKHTGDEAYHDLIGLAQQLQWPEGAVDGKWHTSAHTSEECHDKVALFLERGLWPLTNIIRQVLAD